MNYMVFHVELPHKSKSKDICSKKNNNTKQNKKQKIKNKKYLDTFLLFQRIIRSRKYNKRTRKESADYDVV